MGQTENLPPNIKRYRENKEKNRNIRTDNTNHLHFENDINNDITLEELCKEISLLSNRKVSVGLDGISNQMLNMFHLT